MKLNAVLNFFSGTLFCALLLSISAEAGTIVFKDGNVVSDAEIVSISDGRITIEKDKTKRSFPLSGVKSYYQSDLSGADSGLPGEFSDYKVTVYSVDMPAKGEDSKGKDTSCKIKYSVTVAESGKRVKFPYFYLYVLCSRKGETGRRPVYRYYYPDEAKPKGKGYDQAAIMSILNSFDRPIWGAHKSGRSLSGGLSGREFEIPLKKVGNRDILAYRLEIWGNDSLIETKDWEDKFNFDARDIGKRWWERY